MSEDITVASCVTILLIFFAGDPDLIDAIIVRLSGV